MTFTVTDEQMRRLDHIRKSLFLASLNDLSPERQSECIRLASWALYNWLKEFGVERRATPGDEWPETRSQQWEAAK